MFKVLELSSEGPPRRSTDHDLTASRSDDTLLWIDLCAAPEEELTVVGEAFHFHVTALDDCKRFDQRPKLEPFSDHLFVVLHSIEISETESNRRRLGKAEPSLRVVGRELHAFLGANYLVTVHDQPIRELDAVFERLEREPELMRRGPDYWYYLMSDRIVGGTQDELEKLAQAVEDAEAAVLHGSQREMVDRIFALKRELATARRLVSPQRELFASLARWGAPIVRERTTFYLRSVHDELVRAVENIESLRELLSNALDAHFSAVSQRMNEIMKHLTLLSSIFLPLTFVTGFFGQNFEHLPYGSDALMWTGIAACMALPTAMLLWFRMNRWL